MGYKNHVRLKHGIKLKEVVVPVPNKEEVKEIVDHAIQASNSGNVAPLDTEWVKEILPVYEPPAAAAALDPLYGHPAPGKSLATLASEKVELTAPRHWHSGVRYVYSLPNGKKAIADRILELHEHGHPKFIIEDDPDGYYRHMHQYHINPKQDIDELLHVVYREIMIESVSWINSPHLDA